MKRIRHQHRIHRHLLEGIRTPKQEIINHVKKNMCIDMALKLQEEGLITFEENEQPANGSVGTEINAEVYAMNPEEKEKLFKLFFEIYEVNHDFSTRIRLDEIAKILLKDET